MVQGI